MMPIMAGKTSKNHVNPSLGLMPDQTRTKKKTTNQIILLIKMYFVIMKESMLSHKYMNI